MSLIGRLRVCAVVSGREDRGGAGQEREGEEGEGWEREEGGDRSRRRRESWVGILSYVLVNGKASLHYPSTRDKTHNKVLISLSSLVPRTLESKSGQHAGRLVPSYLAHYNSFVTSNIVKHV